MSFGKKETFGRDGYRAVNPRVSKSRPTLGCNMADLHSRQMMRMERKIDLPFHAPQGFIPDAEAPSASLSRRPGTELLKLACQLGLEGIIAKRLDAPYRPDRGGDWLKIKCVQSETFRVIGWEASASALGGIGRLLLAGPQKGSAGLCRQRRDRLHDEVGDRTALRLVRIAVEKPPVAGIPKKGMRWVEPVLAAEVAFRSWTNDSKLRHASFKGMPDDAKSGRFSAI